MYQRVLNPSEPLDPELVDLCIIYCYLLLLIYHLLEKVDIVTCILRFAFRFGQKLLARTK